LDQQELFELDLFDTMMDQEDESSSDESGGEEDEGFSDISSEEEGDVPDTRAELEAAKAQTFTDAKHIHEMGKKLDAVLLLVFEHFSQVHQRTTGASVHVKKEDPNLPTLPPLPPLPGITTFTDIPDPPTPSTKHQDPLSLAPVPTIESADGLHPQHFTLLSLFERLLLPTFKSRYTQFLLFHSASLSPAFADLFLGLLLERALYQETVPAVTRVAATSYIASFVSRAKFIQQDTAREVVGVLCEYLSNSIVAVETGTGTIGGQDTPTFYAVVQAVFVIFCFRWQDLQDGDEDQKHWMKELGIMQRVLDSVLDPLKVKHRRI
jgi:RNA polymerase I-specific transcription initiation factor RRN3